MAGASRLSFSEAADGQAMLTTPSLVAYWRLCLILCLRHGFVRRGRRVAASGETVYPHFIRGSLGIGAGWDVWTGYYFLACDTAGNAFLRGLWRRTKNNSSWL